MLVVSIETWPSQARMPREAKLYPYFVAGIGLATCALLAISLSPGIILTGCVVLVAGIMLRLLFRGGGG
jgi:hypothetical protein